MPVRPSIAVVVAQKLADSLREPVAIGSHLDTQICGGRYDGILGVLCGLEVVRTLNDFNYETQRPVEVAVWTNEEGSRFQPTTMGSAVFAGTIPIDQALSATDVHAVFRA